MMLQSLTTVIGFYGLVVCSILGTTGISGQTHPAADQSYAPQGYEQQYPSEMVSQISMFHV